MSDRLVSALLMRSSRERLLLGAMVLVALPLAVALGVLLPLYEARLAAEAELRETRALAGWVAERATENAALANTPEVQRTAPVGPSGLETSLKDAQLWHRVAELSGRAEGGVVLRFDAVSFTGLMDWLARSAENWGYMIVILRITETPESGLVAVTLELAPM